MNQTSTKKIIFSTTNVNKEVANEYACEPSDVVINNILNYSKALSVRKSKQIDFFEMVLN